MAEELSQYIMPGSLSENPLQLFLLILETDMGLFLLAFISGPNNNFANNNLHLSFDDSEVQSPKYDSPLCTYRPLCFVFCILGFPDSSAGRESACNAGDPGLIPGSGSTPGQGTGYSLQYSWAPLVAQLVNNPPIMQETWVSSLGWEDPLEKGKATHPSSPWDHRESDMIE